MQFQTCDGSADACINPNGHYAVDIVSIKAVLPSKCDVNLDGAIDVADMQLIINEALSTRAATHDLNGDGAVNVVDIQIVIDAALGLGCYAK